MPKKRALSTPSLSTQLKSKDGFMLRFDTFQNIEQAIRERFLDTGGYVILHEAGKVAGGKAYERYTGETCSKAPGRLLASFTSHKRDANWGIFSFKEIDKGTGTGTIQIERLFEAKYKPRPFVNAEGTICCCPFTSGYLKGFLERIYQKRYDIKPSKCVLKGDEHCELMVELKTTPRE